jgi:Calcineurin-like phosphoesterase superfamily domain
VSLFLIGDVHGKTQEYLAALDAMPKGASSFALGDLYLGRPGVTLPTMEARHRFIRGNHDSPSIAASHPNFAGKFGFIPDDGGLFYLSGAFTVSAPVLQNSKFWHADEELSQQELDAAFDLYRESKPRILLSHEGPSEIVAEMLAGSSGNYTEAKRACIHSRTAQTLQRMVEAHAPKPHFFGHYHRRWTTKRGATSFRCLKELEVCKA